MFSPRKRQIWLEPVLGQNRPRLIERCRAALRAGKEDSFIYLTAARPLCERVTHAVLQGGQEISCRSLPIFTFDDLVLKILYSRPTALSDPSQGPHEAAAKAPTSGSPGERPCGQANDWCNPLIPDSIKYFLMEFVIGALMRQSRLRHLSDIAVTPGCVQTIGDLVAELKRSGLPPEECRRVLREMKGGANDQDLALIYEEYQQVLEAVGIVDIEEAYLRVRDRLTSGAPPDWLSKIEVLFLDGFFDFTPLQDELLTQLFELIPEVVLSLNYDCGHAEIFASVEKTLESLRYRGFSVMEMGAVTVARHPILSALGEQLLRPEAVAFAAAEDVPVRLLSAPNPWAETQEVARQIKRLVLAEGYALSQIALVVRDYHAYAPIIHQVFSDTGIPGGCVDRRPLALIPSVKAALKVIEARIAWDKVESFEALIKNDYFEAFSTRPRDAVVNALLAVGNQTSPIAWLSRAAHAIKLREESLKRTESGAFEPEEIEWQRSRWAREIDALNAAIDTVETLCRVLESIPDRASLSVFVDALTKVLQTFRIQQRLHERLRQTVGSADDLALTALDLRGFEKMNESLNEAAQLLQAARSAPEILSLGEFKSLVERLMGRTVVPRETPSSYGVACLDYSQCHGLDFRAVFVMGMIEGSIPGLRKYDWMYPPVDRQRLHDFGLHLEDFSSSEWLQKENYLFYRCISQAGDRLFLSYPKCRSDGEETIPSSFLGEIGDLLRGAETELVSAHPQGSLGDRLSKVNTPKEVVETLIGALWQGSSEEDLALELYRQAQAKQLFSPSLLLRLQIEAERQGLAFGPFDGAFADSGLRRELSRQFGKERIYSVAELNTYGICPFQFFSRWILRLEAPGPAWFSFSVKDYRRLITKSLAEFLAGHRRARLDPALQPSYEPELQEIMQRKLARFAESRPPAVSKSDMRVWEMEKTQVWETLRKILTMEISYQNKTAQHETTLHIWDMEFGCGGQADTGEGAQSAPLTLTDGPDAVQVRGRIDRLDRSSDGKLVLYDYKASSLGGLDEIRQGIELEIPIHIMALQQRFAADPLDVVGGGYYGLFDGSRQRGLYRADLIHYTGVNPRVAASLSDDEWKAVLQECAAHIRHYVAGMRAGDFRVQPKTTTQCPRCDYRTVCRFDKHRIQRKTP
ncbi:MAG: PD-(D/E)XK nuclease family protein [Acidobacteria bacterium]|nr:PD-(D/E)XK nuclease family protein [Acidobacteriota bacterium]MBI3658494.1 PD-(D/E)XK nuclease family protein [Acidobacteriota bacterium]